jgi:hypothetical protein
MTILLEKLQLPRQPGAALRIHPLPHCPRVLNQLARMGLIEIAELVCTDYRHEVKQHRK